MRRLRLPARFQKATMIAVIALGLPAGSIAAYCGLVVASGNVHTVAEGQVYRSAQLDKGSFDRLITAHAIKSIVNLRGAHADKAWYRDELASAAAHGVAHFDVALSAKRRLSPEAMAELVALLRSTPKPLLIHCQSGADRAGLVAALYRYAIDGDSAAVAAGELSLRYGHFPWLMSKSGAMDESFAVWVASHPVAGSVEGS